MSDLFHWPLWREKFHLGKACGKPLACAAIAAALLLSGCQKKEPLPQPEYPLSEEVLTAALEETGLPWTIAESRENNNGTDTAITHSLHIPEHREDYNGVAINTYDSEELGRRLQLYFNEPQNKLWWEDEGQVAGWEDWQGLLTLVARLYGGFSDAQELYRLCSAAELPLDTVVLWQETVPGGYFIMWSQSLMTPKRFATGNTIVINMYESEEAYLRFCEIAEQSREGAKAN